MGYQSIDETKMIGIFCSSEQMVKSIERYLHYKNQIDDIVYLPIDSPFKKKEVFQKALECDLLIIEGFVDSEPLGFQFAKALEKKTIFLFYNGEIDIEKEGPFWLTLPEGIDKLGDKTKEFMAQPLTDENEYFKLEEHFSELKERNDHHD